jgi:hypothetical protein
MPKYQLDKKLLSKKHLETMLGLTQFSRCWGIIKSHLILYEELEKQKKARHNTGPKS